MENTRPEPLLCVVPLDSLPVGKRFVVAGVLRMCCLRWRVCGFCVPEARVRGVVWGVLEVLGQEAISRLSLVVKPCGESVVIGKTSSSVHEEMLEVDEC